MTFLHVAHFRRFAILALAASAALLSGPLVDRSEAGMIVQVVSRDPVMAGETGAFDVWLVNANDDSRQVSGFSFELSVAAGAGVEFAGVTAGTSSVPYIFETEQEPPLSFDDFPTIQFTASDSSWTAPGYVDLAPNQIVGLGRVSFMVATNTPAGSVPITIILGDGTQVLDSLGQLIELSAPVGAIDVIPSAAIPEPSSLALLAVAGVSLLGFGRWRRRDV